MVNPLKRVPKAVSRRRIISQLLLFALCEALLVYVCGAVGGYFLLLGVIVWLFVKGID